MDKKLKYEDFLRMGVIRRLPEVERENIFPFTKGYGKRISEHADYS